MKTPNLENLSPKDKIWFAQAIAGMVIADGRVDESEIVFLKKAIGFLDDREEIDRLMAIVKQGKPPQLEEAHIDSKQAFSMIKYLLELMIADSRLSPGEIHYFLYTGKLFGYSGEVLVKLWKTARAQLEAIKPKAGIKIGSETYDTIVLTELSEEGFSFRYNHPLVPHTRFMLRVQKPDGDYWEPVSGNIGKQSQEKMDQGSFDISGNFGQNLAESHGILQILHPDQYKSDESEIVKPEKDSLMWRPVQCFACGVPRVQNFVLRQRSMITMPNIFGVPCYKKSAGKLQFCDYNLIQISTCPSCGFSSSDLDFFQRKPDEVPPFNIEKFNKDWERKAKPLLDRVNASKDSYFSEDRSVDQALLSYDLARMTFQRLADIHPNPADQVKMLRKVASTMLIQAEILMENNQRAQAEKNLEDLMKILEPIFPNIESPAIINVALLIFQIKIYFGTTQEAAQYMKFMDDYDKDGELDQGTEEYKTLKADTNKLKNFFDDREIFSRDSLSRFHLDD